MRRGVIALPGPISLLSIDIVRSAFTR